MKEITSLSNSYVKSLEKLYDKKTRENEGLYIIEGYHLVQEAYKSKFLETVLITNIDDEIEDIECILVTNEIIKKLSKTKSPQNILGVCKVNTKIDILGNRVLILDGINDPGNLGTILRSALAFNFKDIIMSNDTVDLYNDKVIRSTQGAHFKLNIIKADLVEYIKKLKTKEYYIVGTSLQSSVSLKSLNLPDKCAVVLGNEANGISFNVLNQTDTNVKIKIDNNVESLNVGVAGAIIMHHINEWD